MSIDCVWCDGSGIIKSTRILCRTCKGSGKVKIMNESNLPGIAISALMIELLVKADKAYTTNLNNASTSEKYYTSIGITLLHGTERFQLYLQLNDDSDDSAEIIGGTVWEGDVVTDGLKYIEGLVTDELLRRETLASASVKTAEDNIIIILNNKKYRLVPVD